LIIVDISNPSSPGIVGSFNNPGNADATGVYVVGQSAYITLASNNEFSVVNISNPSSPVLISSLNLSSKANDLVVLGNHAFIASDDNNQELQVIDISNPGVPTQVTSLNLSGNTDADSMSFNGSVLFIGQGSVFYTIDVSTPTSPSQIGSIGLSGTINDISLNVADSTLVFVATTANNEEFQIIDTVNPSSLIIFGSVNTAGNDDLRGVAYDSNIDRVVGVGDRNNEEIFIFAPQ